MSSKSIYRWIVALAAVNIFGLVLFSIVPMFYAQMILPEGTAINGGVAIFARYMSGRSLALAALLMVALVFRNRQMLGYMLLVGGLVQAFDTVFGAMGSGLLRTVSPAVLCALDLAASYYLLSKAKR